MKEIDFAKPVKTTTGREVRIYATDGGGEYPVHGAIAATDANAPAWWPTSWTRLGTNRNAASCDLVNPIRKASRTAWLITLMDREGHVEVYFYLYEQDKDRAVEAFRKSLVYVGIHVQEIKCEVTEGEGKSCDGC